MDIEEEQIIEYGKLIKKAYPDIDSENLRKALEAKFIYNKDILSLMTVGCAPSPWTPLAPLADFIKIISIIINGARLLFTKDSEKRKRIKKLIDSAIRNIVIVT